MLSVQRPIGMLFRTRFEAPAPLSSRALHVCIATSTIDFLDNGISREDVPETYQACCIHFFFPFYTIKGMDSHGVCVLALKKKIENVCREQGLPVVEACAVAFPLVSQFAVWGSLLLTPQPVKLFPPGDEFSTPAPILTDG
jgi:hypothetical protein